MLSTSLVVFVTTSGKPPPQSIASSAGPTSRLPQTAAFNLATGPVTLDDLTLYRVTGLGSAGLLDYRSPPPDHCTHTRGRCYRRRHHHPIPLHPPHIHPHIFHSSSYLTSPSASSFSSFRPYPRPHAHPFPLNPLPLHQHHHLYLDLNRHHPHHQQVIIICSSNISISPESEPVTAVTITIVYNYSL